MWYTLSAGFGGGIRPPSSSNNDSMKEIMPREEEEIPPVEIPIPRANAESLEAKLQQYRTQGKFKLPPGSGEPIPNALNNRAKNPGAGRMDQHQGFSGDDCKGDNWRHYTPESPLSYYSG